MILDEVGSEKAHKLLHTQYHSRKRISDQLLMIRDTQRQKIEVCVCVGTNCYVKGSQDLLKDLIRYVTDNKLEDIVELNGNEEMVELDDNEEMVDVKATFCFERCDKGPVARINNTVIENADFEKCKNILNEQIHETLKLINTEVE